jgi:hypothetical protein
LIPTGTKRHLFDGTVFDTTARKIAGWRRSIALPKWRNAGWSRRTAAAGQLYFAVPDASVLAKMPMDFSNTVLQAHKSIMTVG